LVALERSSRHREKPETVVGWHRAGFSSLLALAFPFSRRRPRITEEVRVLIKRMAAENPA